MKEGPAPPERAPRVVPTAKFLEKAVQFILGETAAPKRSERDE